VRLLAAHTVPVWLRDGQPYVPQPTERYRGRRQPKVIGWAVVLLISGLDDVPRFFLANLAAADK
jgi:hypothetical protein